MICASVGCDEVWDGKVTLRTGVRWVGGWVLLVSGSAPAPLADARTSSAVLIVK